MRTGPRFLRPATATLILSVFAGLSFGDRVTAQTDLPESSPFAPTDGPVVGLASPAGGFEFVAVVGEGKQTAVCLEDPQTKKPRWISVGAEIGGIAVLSYDAGRAEVVIRIDRAERRLTLRKERGVIPGTTPVAAAAVSLSPAPPTPTSSSATPSAPLISGPFAGAPAVPPAASTPGAKPTPPPLSAAVAKQQEETRMLVSDLLDIGLAQRKAYEAAQKKAAEPNGPVSAAAPSGPSTAR